MVQIKNFLKNYLLIIKTGLLTGLVSILFECINLLVIYKQVKLDYYLCMVALLFLGIGLSINKRENKPKLPKQNLDLLTNKELQIFHMVAAGNTNKEIAAAHFIEVSTVKTHINNIYSKLSVSNRKEARSVYAALTGGNTNF